MATQRGGCDSPDSLAGNQRSALPNRHFRIRQRDQPSLQVCMFVLSEALHQTGVSESIGQWINRIAGSQYRAVSRCVMLTVAGLSAFTHHVTTTAMMLPPMLTLSRERSIPASKLLMPLSFAASLGTTITIIGAPAFLLASSLLQQADRPGLGIFSIAPLGIILTVAGTLFMVLIGRFLLPSREASVALERSVAHQQLFYRITDQANSRLIGKTLEQIKRVIAINSPLSAGFVTNSAWPIPFPNTPSAKTMCFSFTQRRRISSPFNTTRDWNCIQCSALNAQNRRATQATNQTKWRRLWWHRMPILSIAPAARLSPPLWCHCDWFLATSRILERIGRDTAVGG